MNSSLKNAHWMILAFAFFCSACASSGSAIGAERAATPTPKPDPAKPVVRSTPPPITIHELTHDDSAISAGTTFQLASEPPNSDKVIFAHAAEDEEATMRINNQLYKLKQTSS